jgi:hypothetical protein
MDNAIRREDSLVKEMIRYLSLIYSQLASSRERYPASLTPQMLGELRGLTAGAFDILEKNRNACKSSRMKDILTDLIQYRLESFCLMVEARTYLNFDELRKAYLKIVLYPFLHDLEKIDTDRSTIKSYEQAVAGLIAQAERAAF